MLVKKEVRWARKRAFLPHTRTLCSRRGWSMNGLDSAERMHCRPEATILFSYPAKTMIRELSGWTSFQSGK